MAKQPTEAPTPQPRDRYGNLQPYTKNHSPDALPSGATNNTDRGPLAGPYKPTPELVAGPRATVQDGPITDGILGDILKELRVMNALGPAVTGTESVFSGADIGLVDNYKVLFENRRTYPVAIEVQATFTVPGQAVKIAYSPDKSDVGVIEILSNNGKTISRKIVVGPGQKIYINTNDASFNLSTPGLDGIAPSFRVLSYDRLRTEGL